MVCLGRDGRIIKMVSFIKLVQKRISNISIGPSTLRGQPTGTINLTREFLKSFDLNIFNNTLSESDFLNKLDEQTNLLKEKIHSKSWGIARKALNIFLFQSSHDIFLSKEYGLNKIIPFLEVPLDNPNAKKLVEMAEQKGIKLRWNNIKSLIKEDSYNLQKFAKQVSNEEYNCDRCYLDLYFWRGNKVEE